MNLIEAFRADFDEEMPSTRKTIANVPDGRGEWRPHPKSFPLGHLAQLVARMPGWLTNMATSDKLDLATYKGYSFESTATLLAEFDQHVKEARAALASVQESRLDDPWSLVAGDKTILTTPRGVSFRQTLRHLVHHRAQLGVYLRLLDVPVPSTFGPSADDRGGFSL